MYAKPKIGYMGPEVCGVVQGKSFKLGIYKHKMPSEITYRLNVHGGKKELQDLILEYTGIES